MARVLVEMRLDDLTSRPNQDGSKVYFNAVEEREVVDAQTGERVRSDRFSVGIAEDAWSAVQKAKGQTVLLEVTPGASMNGRYPRPNFYNGRLAG